MLVSSIKFQSKAEEVVKEGLDKPLKLEIVQKHLAGSESTEQIQLESSKDDAGGMMLYTSGTTSRPVRSLSPRRILLSKSSAERRASPQLSPHRAKPIPPPSLEIHRLRPPPTCSPPPPHPRNRQRSPYASLCRFLHRIPLSLERQRRMGPPRRALPPSIRQPQESAHYIPYRRAYHLQPPLVNSLRAQIPYT